MSYLEHLDQTKYNNRASQSSSAEDLFVDIFQEALGFERAQLLIAQYPVEDIYQNRRFIDFAIVLSELNKYAFEVDGEAWHSPSSPLNTPEKFRDALLRQNSLIYQGWKVYRWTDYQLAAEREKVKEQLLLFLEKELSKGHLDGFLPLQEAGEVSLLAHQKDALQELFQLRSQGKTIALVTHATGTGKTHIAISDAKLLNQKTLYLAHRTTLLSQTKERFAELWPEAGSTIYHKQGGKTLTKIVLSTIQAIAGNLDSFDPKEFGYIIIDEAHHATAETYCKIIGHFKPRFLLGLTATPERYDGQSLVELFRNTAHRLELEEAVAGGLLVPIRCVRVHTNVDLSKIRFNGVDYRASDLEELVIMPSRDNLIVQTYKDHVVGKRAVCFCVNVAHAERMATEFNNANIVAACVSGCMSIKQREQILASYKNGEIKVLCACDMLNEGWDSPETEVLLMARPTLSKVLYIQQLGRGTRTFPGKDCLIVFDFIDNTSRYAFAMSVHRLLRKPSYLPGSLVAAPPEIMAMEEEQIKNGEKPIAILQLHLWAEHYEPIDIFRWQDEVKDMYQTSQLEVELGVGEGTVSNWIKANKIAPDHSIELGSKIYHYFKKERLPEICQAFNLTPITSENIKEQFFEFVQEMDMTMSYKPVLLLGMLQSVDANGRIKTTELVDFFRKFYLARHNKGQTVERKSSKLNRIAEMTDAEIEQIMLTMPFEKFERRKYVRRMKELSILKFSETLWPTLTNLDKEELKNLAQKAITSYYERISK